MRVSSSGGKRKNNDYYLSLYSGSAIFVKTDSCISYTGLDDVTVTLTKGEDKEIPGPVVDNDSTTILVGYDRAGIVFQIQLNSRDLPTNPLVDVKETKYYYDHALCALDQNITTGITETTFSLTAPVQNTGLIK